MRWLRFISLALALGMLPGCGVFIAGMATGSLVGYDTRDWQTWMDDQAIRKKISAAIKKDPAFAKSHITVTSFNRTVLLTGQAPASALRLKAEKISKQERLAIQIYNEITVGAPTSLATRSHDTWLTTKVKSQLLAIPDLKSNAIKVLTENGSVYLMGHLTHLQAQVAVETARSIAGVKRVVKVFKYVQLVDELSPSDHEVSLLSEL